MAVRKLTEAGGLSLDPRGTGRMLVKIIDVGEGSSAIYTSEALRLAESERVFRAGTHMYLDHAAWESERRDPGGNRSVRDLASVLTSDARWDEQQQALVAEAATDDRRDQLQRAIRAAHADPASDTYTWVQDFDDVVRVVWFSTGAQTWQQTYDVAADDRSVTLTGERTEVRPVTQYLPVSSTAGVTEGKDSPMPEISQAELDRLTADAAKLAEAQKRAADAEAALAEATARQAVAEARKSAAAKVAEATAGLPAVMVGRIQSAIESQVSEQLPADIETRITAAIEAEKAYVVALNPDGDRLVGFGRTTDVTESAIPARTHNAFGRKIGA